MLRPIFPLPGWGAGATIQSVVVSNTSSNCCLAHTAAANRRAATANRRAAAVNCRVSSDNDRLPRLLRLRPTVASPPTTADRRVSSGHSRLLRFIRLSPAAADHHRGTPATVCDSKRRRGNSRRRQSSAEAVVGGGSGRPVLYSMCNISLISDHVTTIPINTVTIAFLVT